VGGVGKDEVAGGAAPELSQCTARAAALSRSDTGGRRIRALAPRICRPPPQWQVPPREQRRASGGTTT
jgi:hypothetical protein